MSSRIKTLYEFEGFRVDPEEQTLSFENEVIPLTPRVYETLFILIKNSGRLVTKDKLMDEIWGDTIVEERNLTQNVFTLRKEFKKRKKEIEFIETIPKRGYKFVAIINPVEIEQEETLAVNHKKSLNITAEGSVSKKELTDAVKEIAKDLMPAELSEEAKQKKLESQSSGLYPTFGRSFHITAFVLFLLLFGVGIWTWQNDYLNTKKTAFATDSERPALDFQRLTDSGKAYFPAISPDKQFIAYTVINKNKYSIHLQNLATGSKTVVVGPEENEIGRPKFSADGNYIFYRQDIKLGGPANAYRVPIFGGTPQIIAEGTTSDIGLSPDGKRIAFVREVKKADGKTSKSQSLIVYKISDGTERVVATRNGNKSFTIWQFHPSWSPDGKKLLIGLVTEPTPENTDIGKTEFVAMNVADGSFDPVKMPEWDTHIQTEWMPDGKSLIFLARQKPKTPFQIWEVQYPSGVGRQITFDTNDYRYVSVAPDGSFLLTAPQKTFFNLWVVSLLNPKEAKQLTFSSENKYGNSGIVWTKDGKNLVYTLAEDGLSTNIWKIDIETLKQTQLTFDTDKLNWFPKVKPDGNSVIFSSNRKDGWHIWQINLDGSNLRQITDGVGENHPNISSDGKWLVYSSPGNTPTAIWKKSLLNDEKPIKIADSMGSNSLSPDDKNLVFSYMEQTKNGKRESKYGIISLDSNKSLSELDFNPYFGSMTWKTDGSGFYWISDGRDINNILSYSIENNSKQQVTDFNELRMLQLSLSPDGNTIATARGRTVSNIIKISRIR